MAVRISTVKVQIARPGVEAVVEKLWPNGVPDKKYAKQVLAWIAEANEIRSFDTISPGDKLTVPAQNAQSLAALVVDDHPSRFEKARQVVEKESRSWEKKYGQDVSTKTLVVGLPNPFSHGVEIAKRASVDALTALALSHADATSRAAAKLHSSRIDEAPADRTARPIQFPKDELPHKSPIEWWYYTGKVTGDASNPVEIGFEVVVFKEIVSPGVPLYLSNIAFTDVKNNRFVSDSGVVPIPHSPRQGFDLEVGPVRTKGFNGKDTIKGKAGEYELALNLTSDLPPALQFETGHMKIGSDAPLYYYSRPNMEAGGTITIDGKKVNVTGTVWMDHQWGTIGDSYQGWDWFSLRMDDGSSYMFFLVREKDRENFVQGSFIRPDGSVQALKKEQFQIDATGRWVSPHTGGKYPSGWKISVPEHELAVTVQPVVLDQEIVQDLAPSYWEGLCEVKGSRQGKSIGGNAYVELDGYAKKK